MRQCRVLRCAAQAPACMLDQMIAEVTTDDSTLSEQGKLNAGRVQTKWEDLKNMIRDGEVRILVTIEQQKVYAEDRAEADEDDEPS